MSIQTSKPLVTTISNLVAERIGLMPGKALQDAIEEVGGDDLGALVRALESSDTGSPAWQAILRALMIGETYFFRQRAQLNWLRQMVMPDLLKRHSNSMSLWSAGCATGEEVYSLAITLYENLSPTQRHNIHLIGSDINRTALDTARRGLYRDWSFRHTDLDFKDRYFIGVETGLQIKPFIRQMVTFTPNNLLTSTPINKLDVITCCNVLLYLHEEAVQQVENHFFEALTPGGWLLLGQAETLHTDRDRWLTHLYAGGVAYQKPLENTVHNRIVYHKAHPPQAPAIIQVEPEPRSLYEEAVALLRAKQADEAETILREILASQANDARAHILLGCILANRRQIADAHAELDVALDGNPLQADAHYLKGMLYLESQQQATAEEAFKSALYCHKGHPLTAVMLGNLYAQSGAVDKARRIWTAALENLNGHSTAHVSDLSDLTVDAMRELLENQINE
ncbi:MAG: tetratricopeptide repeat protein [Anaerolineaceae bacterium]|nr:tetratricopeptide repeat protein [Anaerolineaceae bacterium]